MTIVRDAAGRGEGGGGQGQVGRARSVVLPHHRADHRPHQPHAGDGGQLDQRRLRRRRHAADHHRQPGPDLHLLRRQREQLHQVQAAGRARRRRGRRRPRRARRDRRCPTSAASRTRRALDFLDNRLDQGTGTLRARAVLRQPGGAVLARHVRARARAPARPAYAALLLPDEAIGTDQTNKFVYVVGEDGTVARRNVKLGPLVRGPARGARRRRGRGLGDHQRACSARAPAAR